MFKSVIDEMRFATDFKLINMLQRENANLTPEDLNTCLDQPETRWNIHLVSHDTLISRVRPSSNGKLSHCSSSFGYLMSLIGTRRKIVWAGDLHSMRELDSNLKSPQRRFSIHSMTGVFRRCGCFQVILNIQRMIL